jgi:hypothetical protein
MWLFAPTGFFSVVKNSAGSGLMVRARVAADLDSLRELMPQLSATVAWPNRDYPYRAFISHESFAEGMMAMVMSIDYGNFKNEVMKSQGMAREQLYHKVWDVMYDAEERLKAPIRQHWRREEEDDVYARLWKDDK